MVDFTIRKVKDGYWFEEGNKCLYTKSALGDEHLMITILKQNIFNHIYILKTYDYAYASVTNVFPNKIDVTADYINVTINENNQITNVTFNPQRGGKRVKIAWISTGKKIDVRIRDNNTQKIKKIQKTLYTNVKGKHAIKYIRDGVVVYTLVKI
jgi:hypothetical protein